MAEPTLTDDEVEKLQKTVQAKLSQAEKLLEECTVLAEKGGFEFTFNTPGETYYPSNLSMFTDEDVLERLRENVGDEVSSYTPDELTEALEDIKAVMIAEELPEYAELGGWWMPSRIC
jgi:hypothetical protein